MQSRDATLVSKESAMPYKLATADEALKAAFEAGALTICPVHPYNLIRASDPETRLNAYHIGQAKIDQGFFRSERWLLIQATNDVIRMGEEECPCCYSWPSSSDNLPPREPALPGLPLAAGPELDRRPR
jgi:hypothetical protein